MCMLPQLTHAIGLLCVPLILASSGGERRMDDLPLNRIQVIGSHNSYKQSIDPALLRIIRNRAGAGLARSLDYSHVSLTEQLDLGLGNLEIDLFSDTIGGRYTHPMGLALARKGGLEVPYDPAGKMKGSGFKVMHVQDLDFRSNVLTLRDCLTELKAWSDAHPDHYPIFITVNAKDQRIPIPGFTKPEKFSRRTFDLMDSTIRHDLGSDHLLTPDNIRGNYPTLESAVLAGHWPTMDAARGKFIFILDEKGAKMAAYIHGHPSCGNRVMFVDGRPGTPEAAFLIVNDPIKDAVKISELVRKGYIVRTRADADTEEARRNDKSRFNAACASGAQIITTDYYQKSTHFISDYVVNFDPGVYLRENPLQ